MPRIRVLGEAWRRLLAGVQGDAQIPAARQHLEKAGIDHNLATADAVDQAETPGAALRFSGLKAERSGPVDQERVAGHMPRKVDARLNRLTA